MKKTKILSLLLCLSLFCALIVPCTKAYAKSDPDSGMKISKTATANGDGSYTITLEAYATGSKVISEVKEDVPTDIVLVLDQSGSMADDIGTVSFEQYKDEPSWSGGTTHTRNRDYYEYRHNGGSGNLWHKLGDDSFVSVSVTKQEQMKYTQLSNLKNCETRWGSLTENCYYYYANNLYEKVGEEYKKVSLTRQWISTGLFQGHYQYTYTFSNGDSIQSNGDDESPELGSHARLYTSVVDTTYTYTYTDANGVTQTIGISTGAETVFSPTLYERVTSTSGGGTRLDALKNAVNNFASAVHTKSLGKDGQVGGGDDIDHRIALVGFSSPDYRNTELLTGSRINQGSWHGTNISTSSFNGYYYFPTGYEMNGPQYGSISNAQYKAALLAMNTDAGWTGVTSGVNALTAWGGTRTDNGLAMANKIFEQNPISNGEKRNRVVIVFTDGIPGLTGYDSDVASSAITQASTAKSTYGATVYAIGIFSGADATSAGSTGNTSSDADKGNYFLQQVSSNNGTPRSPSYYLSAGDSASLNNIFQQISNQIETGGSSSTLTSEAVVKDIISPYFTLPEGATDANITLETYKCTGKSGDAYTWSKNTDAMGAKASINGDQVSVTGFNFSDNYVGTVTENGNTTYRGNKLVISFKVQPKQDFLGGNDVITNTSAGIYENNNAKDPIMTFDQPTVNVPIKNVIVTATDKNVYLKGEVTADQLKDGAKISVGGVELDLSKATDTEKPYGLEAWQTKYVNITVEVKDNAGNVISDKLADLTDDTTYTVTVTVSPKTEGTSTPEKGNAATAKTGFNDPAANIYVFKPELTYKDSEVYYGDTAPDCTGNLTQTKWKHGETLSDAEGVTMIGTAPTLDPTYTPEAGKIADGKINTKEDISVDVSVKIGTDDVTDETSFVHTKCDETCTDPANGKFWIHVKTCTLSITKTGGADGEPYVFDIYKDDDKYSEVTVKGNGTETLVELPVGTYTIKEDTGWSWRYSADNGGGAALTAQNPTGSITCTNTKNNDKWLNGFSDVVKNISGVSHNN